MPLAPDETSASLKTKKKYTLRLSQTLLNRIEKHLSCLKFVHSSSPSKRKWVLQAIHQKMDREKSTPFPDPPKRGTILLEIDPELSETLEQRVDMIRKVRGSYSLKSWLVDAIEERLELEARQIEKEAAELQTASIKEEF
jgi:hypothetical protein